MAVNSVNGLILRIVAVTLAVNVLLHYKLLQSKAAAELVVSPLWHTDMKEVNTSESCDIHEDNENHSITIHGGISATICQFHITTSNDSAIWIKIPDKFAKNNYLLYAQLLEGFEHCPYRLVVIDGRNHPCEAVLFHQNSLLNLQGNVSVLIRKISAQQSEPITCFETNKMSRSKVSLTLPNCSATPYHDTIVCAIEGTKTCNLNFPENCNSTLGFREVTRNCSTENTFDQRVLIVYPIPTLVLDASANNIVAVNVNAFQQMYHLQEIQLQYNELHTLNHGVFNGLDNLLFLNLQGNALRNLDPSCFQGLDMILILDLSYNRLRVLPPDLFHNLTELSTLWLNSNELVMLDVNLFKDLNSLKILYLYDNQLVTLEAGLFQGLGNLTRISLSFNELVNLNANLFQGLENVEILTLQYNKLSKLEGGLFQDLKRLTVLQLHSNELVTLNATLFQGLQSLEILTLHYNQLVTLDVGLFQGLQSLETLYLLYNQLVTLDMGLFQGLQSLETLYLHYNQLVTLDVGLFQGLHSLEILYLTGNQLVTLPVELFEGLSNLTELGLHANDLVSLDGNLFQGLQSLEGLYLHYNQLVTCDSGLFDGLSNLASLTLNNNTLVTLYHNVFEDLNNMIGLFLNYNQLNSLPTGIFHGLNNLKALALRYNRISSLEADIFTDLIHLHTLELRDNNLKHVDSGLFRNTVNLRLLLLKNNKLQSIPTINHLINLNRIHLEGNDLQHVNSRTFSGLQSGVTLLVSQHEICECYVPQNVTCSASSDRSPYLACERLLSDRALVIVMWLIGINALCGNTYVLCWRNKNNGKDKYKVQSLLLSNLALSDLLMGVYMIIIAIADITFGNEFPMRAESWRTGITCKIAGALSIISSEASVFFVTIISADRFINMTYPFNSTYKLGTRSTIRMIVLAWVLAAALGIVPSILAGKYPAFYDNSHVCIGLPLTLTEMFSTNRTTQIYHTEYATSTFQISQSMSHGLKPGLYFSSAVFLGINSACYILIVCCYIIIVQKVRNSSKQVRQTQKMRDQIKLTAKVTVIVATDFLCWAPIIIMGILVQSQIMTLPPSVYAWSVTFILPINSAINPYLYTIADIISSHVKETKNDDSKHVKKQKPPHELSVIAIEMQSEMVSNVEQDQETTI